MILEKKGKVMVCGTRPVHTMWKALVVEIVEVDVHSVIDRAGRKGVFSVVCRNSDNHYLGSSVVDIEGLMDPSVLAMIAHSEALSLPLI